VAEEAAAPAAGRPWATVAALGLAQIISWGSFYYAFALLLAPLGARLRAEPAGVVGAFSLALLVTGLLSAPAGAWIDRHGGRGLMTAGSLAGALLLALLSQVQSLVQLYLVWAGLGAVMAATLYDPAFAVLARLFRQGPRKAITVLTLFGGFASTVFWPLTQGLIAGLGWQAALWVLAALNLLVCAPLHAFFLPAGGAATVHARTAQAAARGGLATLLRQPSFAWLCAAFTANTLVFSALAVHLIGLLGTRGLTPAQAAWVGACIGPMQVLGRLLEYLFLARWRPSRLGALTLWLLPLSLGALLASQGLSPLLALFALCYGAGNGMMTIVRGALPAELYGRLGYGLVNGALATPVLLSKAGGPLGTALLLGWLQPGQLILALAGLGVLAALLFALALRAHGRGEAQGRASA